MQTAAQPTSGSPQASPATVALVNLDAQAAEHFRTAFGHFGISTADVAESSPAEFDKQKFDGCVLRLNRESLALLKALRQSKQNKNIAVLAIADGDEVPFANLGLNAVVRSPVERAEVQHAVHSTHLLILHELRRHVRVPIVLEVKLTLEGGAVATGLTQDVSYGGVSVSTPEHVYPDADVETTFALPDGGAVAITGRVIWRRSPHLLGIRFSPDDQRRRTLRNWIDDYLEMY